MCLQPCWPKVFLAAVFTFICSLIHSRLGNIDDLSIIPTIAEMIEIIFTTDWCIPNGSTWLNGSKIEMVFFTFSLLKIRNIHPSIEYSSSSTVCSFVCWSFSFSPCWARLWEHRALTFRNDLSHISQRSFSSWACAILLCVSLSSVDLK